MPDSYRDCADFLVETLRRGSDGNYADQFIYPIVYLYRHATEMQLKRIIEIGMRAGLKAKSSNMAKLLGGHGLSRLWDEARCIIDQTWPNSDEDATNAVEKMVREMDAADPDGQHLRYSRAKDGSGFKPKLPNRTDLLHLRESFAGLWTYLNGSTDGLLELEQAQS
jgi:hypothetical protein